MKKKKSIKIVPRKLNEDMSMKDFQQTTLLANLIAICSILVKREPAGSDRRAGYAKLHKDARRIESSIPGHLEGRVTDASVRFYAEMHDAVIRFLNSFNKFAPQQRDSKGRFLPRELDNGRNSEV